MNGKGKAAIACLTILALLLTFCFGCAEEEEAREVVAQFVGVPTTGTVPLEVSFADQSTGDPTSWEWDFDNDGTVDSTSRNPTHTYSVAGTYSVSLTVTGPDDSDTETKSNYIRVAEVGEIIADFVGSPTSGTAPLEVQFTDQSAGEITAWVWDFGDGQASTEQSPSHTYDTVGEYTVSLAVTGPTGSDEEVKTDLILVTEAEKVTITIGDLTDFTGPGHDALTPISWALADYAEYINEQGLIPGVELKVVAYDTQYNAERFGTGYEWLRDQGAQVIFTAPPYVAEMLKARAALDKCPIICATATAALVDDPGWVFTLNNISYDQADRFYQWLAEEHWDWETNGPAKIGMVGYNMQPNIDYRDALVDYCDDHQEQFEFVYEALVTYGTMTWSAEVAQLADCDYVGVGPVGAVMPTTFIDQFRAAGHEATLFGSDSLSAYQGAVVGKVGWDAVDGTLTHHGWGWWTLESPEVELVRDLLYANHPAEAYDVRRMGIGGAGGGIQTHFALQLIKAVIEEVGAENFDGQAFYDVAQTLTVSLPGCGELSFTEASRAGRHAFNVWEWSAAEEDLVLVSDQWVAIP